VILGIFLQEKRMAFASPIEESDAPKGSSSPNSIHKLSFLSIDRPVFPWYAPLTSLATFTSGTRKYGHIARVVVGCTLEWT
jgi:hypothetical protein